MANESIKKAALKNKVLLWEVAERFGVEDTTFSKWLRKPFTAEKERQALIYIAEIAATKNGES